MFTNNNSTPINAQSPFLGESAASSLAAFTNTIDMERECITPPATKEGEGGGVGFRRLNSFGRHNPLEPLDIPDTGTPGLFSQSSSVHDLSFLSTGLSSEPPSLPAAVLFGMPDHHSSQQHHYQQQPPQQQQQQQRPNSPHFQPQLYIPQVKEEPQLYSPQVIAAAAEQLQQQQQQQSQQQQQQQSQQQTQFCRAAVTTPEGPAPIKQSVLQPVQQKLVYGGDENSLEKPMKAKSKSKSKGKKRTYSSPSGSSAALACTLPAHLHTCSGGAAAACASGGGGGGASKGKRKGKGNAAACKTARKTQRRKIDLSELNISDVARRRLIMMFSKQELRSEPSEWKAYHKARLNNLSPVEADFITAMRRNELSCVYAERQRQRKIIQSNTADQSIRALQADNRSLKADNKRLREQVAAFQANCNCCFSTN